MKYISFYNLLLAIVFTLDEADSNHRWLLYLVAGPVMWIEIFIIHLLEVILMRKWKMSQEEYKKFKSLDWKMKKIGRIIFIRNYNRAKKNKFLFNKSIDKIIKR